jgi:hypothetical protein
MRLKLNCLGDNLTIIFLDSNILAKPVTRTLILTPITEGFSRRKAVWSRESERGGQKSLDRRLPDAIPLASFRKKFGFDVSNSGRINNRFSQSSESDRQILADCEQSNATFLITEDVDDFNDYDLALIDTSAVHPDLYLASTMTTDAYLATLQVLSRRKPLADTHAALGKNHPRLVKAMQPRFPEIEPYPPVDRPPKVSFTGTRCIRCSRELEDQESIAIGIGPVCRTILNS